MSTPPESGYDRIYSDFDSDLRRQIRAEAYGEDVGQHSWVTAVELDWALSMLALSDASRVLDIGCGPGGPLVFIARRIGCEAVGIDVSGPAIAAARRRVAGAGLEGRVFVRQVDADAPLDFSEASFHAVTAIDVVLHVHDRARLFVDVARLLKPGGRFWFTDAAVVTGAVSNEEIGVRAAQGFTQLVPPGFNEQTLADAGLLLVRVDDRTESLLQNASGRLNARLAHRRQVEELEGADAFDRQQRYLDMVITLARRRAMTRVSYVAERV